jgi:hypothetical protein
MTLDLQSIPDAELLAEYRRREDIERNFAWAVSLMRDYASWESESGRARKVTEWHARQIAEKLCNALALTREEFSRRVIEHSRRTN